MAIFSEEFPWTLSRERATNPHFGPSRAFFLGTSTGSRFPLGATSGGDEVGKGDSGGRVAYDPRKRADASVGPFVYIAKV